MLEGKFNICPEWITQFCRLKKTYKEIRGASGYGMVWEHDPTQWENVPAIFDDEEVEFTQTQVTSSGG